MARAMKWCPLRLLLWVLPVLSLTGYWSIRVEWVGPIQPIHADPTAGHQIPNRKSGGSIRSSHFHQENPLAQQSWAVLVEVDIECSSNTTSLTCADRVGMFGDGGLTMALDHSEPFPMSSNYIVILRKLLGARFMMISY